MAGTNHRRSIANWWLLLRAMAAYITTLLSIRCEQVFVHLLPSLILHPYFLFWLTAKLCEILPQQFSTGSWYLTPLNVSQFFSGLECNDAMKREQGEEEKKIAICPACEWLFLKYLFYIYIYAAVAAAVSCWLCMMYGLYGVAPANMMHTYPHIQDGVLRLRSTVWTFPFISNLVFFLLWSARLSPTIDILLLANCADMPSHMTYTAHTMLSYAIAFGWFAKKKLCWRPVYGVYGRFVSCVLSHGAHPRIQTYCQTVFIRTIHIDLLCIMDSGSLFVVALSSFYRDKISGRLISNSTQLSYYGLFIPSFLLRCILVATDRRPPCGHETNVNGSGCLVARSRTWIENWGIDFFHIWYVHILLVCV